MSISLNVDFSERFENIVNADIAKIADQALTRTIVEADSICQQEAPVDTGTLRRSIGTSHPGQCIVCLTAGVKYWVYLQYGTRKMNANPFVTRTAKRIKSQNLISKNLNDVLASSGMME